MGKTGGNAVYRWADGSDSRHPWYLRSRSFGCWLWMLSLSMLLGIFASLAWWWVVTALLGVALALLARDPQD